MDPPFVQARMTGGAFSDRAVYNATSGTFSHGNALPSGINRCVNGDCSLPGETAVSDEGCFSTVSVFTVDYDAPLGRDQARVRTALKGLVQYENSPVKMSVNARDKLSRESHHSNRDLSWKSERR